ncbi:lytic polysaccharide monooxygenase [Periconia macrospinosa]|uniref:lytic cellulose monooxygenase (C4-dehydrogenating) n=1 Tax=Periconia macrospinosa TaxID=97972 RepID=A0A2V1DH86_9PLEO|nr:lytic polysaccharide monooxygenase [Periconia macrospinosa]
MKYFLSILGLVATAAAHGYVDNATIGGQLYTFYQPFQDPYTNPTPQRISRVIQGNGPVEDVTLVDLQCGGNTAGGVSGSKPAALHAEAAAGSEVTLRWTLWADSHIGPLITYMAKCPDTGCNGYMPGTDAVWFKIQEEGLSGKTWASQALMKSPALAKYTIPTCLKPGYYLVRHETIALHGAFNYPGAQSYPSCHQLKVTGSGNATPASNLVAFPGAYKGTDPGIKYNAYANGT